MVLAHFYIWFNVTSWNRAKKDYPLIGRYSSDQVSVMRTQVRQAKSAGISGFIVSWKSTPALNTRLSQLVQIARQEHFKLAITYETRDFNRTALPGPQVANDLGAFANQYATDPVFDIFGKPLVVLSGSWQFSTDDIRAVTTPLRSRLLILASEKTADTYATVAPYVDGDLYYWSSVDPFTMKGYTERLQALGNAVRSTGGLWIAPVAPGYDGRLIGGTAVVDRRDGATLRAEWQAALSTAPSAIGVISWNEFSENTYIEPSVTYGTTSLDVLKDLIQSKTPSGELDSSDPVGRGSTTAPLVILGGTAAVFVVCIGAIVRRGLRTHP